MSKCPVCNNGEGGMLVRRYESCPSCDGAPPAPLDEARMREILGREAHMAGIGLPFDTEAHERSVLAAMSRAISEARAEQRERDARIVEAKALEVGRKECCGRGQQSAYDEPPECCGDPDLMLTATEAAAAIRSQDDPDKQGE